MAVQVRLLEVASHMQVVAVVEMEIQRQLNMPAALVVVAQVAASLLQTPLVLQG
jgi:uncharacterized protein YigA (DUF484 family)